MTWQDQRIGFVRTAAPRGEGHPFVRDWLRQSDLSGVRFQQDVRSRTGNVPRAEPSVRSMSEQERELSR
jgi:hypothetical protein